MTYSVHGMRTLGNTCYLNATNKQKLENHITRFCQSVMNSVRVLVFGIIYQQIQSYVTFLLVLFIPKHSVIRVIIKSKNSIPIKCYPYMQTFQNPLNKDSCNL